MSRQSTTTRQAHIGLPPGPPSGTLVLLAVQLSRSHSKPRTDTSWPVPLRHIKYRRGTELCPQKTAPTARPPLAAHDRRRTTSRLPRSPATKSPLEKTAGNPGLMEALASPIAHRSFDPRTAPKRRVEGSSQSACRCAALPTGSAHPGARTVGSGGAVPHRSPWAAAQVGWRPESGPFQLGPRCHSCGCTGRRQERSLRCDWGRSPSRICRTVERGTSCPDR